MENHCYTTSDSTCSIEYKLPIDVKIGQYALLKTKPCKIMQVFVFKTGKHGEAKYHFVGIDIFTGKKLEELYMCHHTMSCPIVEKNIMKLLFADRTGYCQLQDEKTLKLKEDLFVCNEDMLKNILDAFTNDKEIYVSVQKAVGQEMICDVRIK